MSLFPPQRQQVNNLRIEALPNPKTQNQTQALIKGRVYITRNLNVKSLSRAQILQLPTRSIIPPIAGGPSQCDAGHVLLTFAKNQRLHPSPGVNLSTLERPACWDTCPRSEELCLQRPGQRHVQCLSQTFSPCRWRHTLRRSRAPHRTPVSVSEHNWADSQTTARPAGRGSLQTVGWSRRRFGSNW